MRGTVSPYQVKLNAKARKRLDAVVRRRSPSHWLVLRAKIVLLSSRRMGNFQISSALTVDHQVVRRWLKRFGESGVDGLKDRERSGRPATIGASVWSKLATIVVQLPEKFGLPFARWSVRSLEALLADRYGWQVSRASINRFLREMALKPHRVRYWLNPSDPDFDRKAARICKLYVSPPARATVLSIDEKPGVQALRRKYPTQPMKLNRPARVEFEYQRKGTRNIFAAFNIKSGQVLVWVTPDRTLPNVLAFLDQLVRFYRRGKLIIITDNIATRTGEPARAWLAAHPRVRFVFTPIHGSWLNQVEIWFGILTSKALRARSFESVRHLTAAIYRFARHWNESLARPFHWTYTGRVLHV